MPSRHPPLAPKVKRIICRLKVTLLDVEPRVWRRIEIPEEATLGDLHRALQVVMGWTDSHLHQFRLDDERFGSPMDDSPPDEEDEDAYALGELLDVGDELEYVYDFGDDWQHHLIVEAVLLAEPRVKYPRCVDGANATPEEDSGGPMGLAAFGGEAPVRERPFPLKAVNLRLQRAFKGWHRPPLAYPELSSPDDAVIPVTDDGLVHGSLIQLLLTPPQRDLILAHTNAPLLHQRIQTIPRQATALVLFTAEELGQCMEDVKAAIRRPDNVDVRSELLELAERMHSALHLIGEHPHGETSH